jgi:hypothetical protein
LWIVPLLAIWSSAGLVSLFLWIRPKLVGQFLALAVPAVIVVGMAVNAISFAYSAKIDRWGEDPIVEDVTVAILPHLTPDSYVIVNGCYDARYWFYFFNHGVPLSVFYNSNKPRPFDRVFAIVYDQPKVGCGTEPAADTYRLFGPDLTLLDMNTLEPVETVDYVTVYEALPYP